MKKMTLRSLLLAPALLVAIVAVLLAVVNLLPGHSRSQEVAGLVLTNLLPHFVVTSAIALLIGLALRRKRPGRLARATTATAAVALIALAVLTVRIMWAARAAGGSVNPIAALAISSPRSSPPDGREVYVTVEEGPLEAWIWRPPPTTTPAPILVEIHGGGWSMGTPNAPSLRWFADRGWLVVSVEYRLSTATQPTWERAPRDVACALAWTAANAARLGGDADRIVLSGQSAGGNLAINLGYAAALGRAEAGCGAAVPVPTAIVTYVPAVDPQDAYDRNITLPGVAGRRFVTQYIGGMPDALPDRMRAISAATYLSPKAPPTLIVEPEEDGFVPAEGVFRFADRARAAGVDITVARLPVVNHYAMFANTMADQAIRTITQRWLEERVGFFRPSR
jgi:acetyl esterase/lipase